MENYNYNIQDIKIKNGAKNYLHTKQYNTDKNMTNEDVKIIYEQLKKDGINPKTILIRAKSNTNLWTTIKQLNEIDMDLNELEKYYRNRVKDASFFCKYVNIQISFYHLKK